MLRQRGLRDGTVPRRAKPFPPAPSPAPTSRWQARSSATRSASVR
ncbi:hypothetical protein P0F65_09220 [Sphingomonas sp. I4]